MNKPVYKTSHQMGSYSPIIILLLLGFFPVLAVGLLILGIYTAYVSIIYDGYPIELIFPLVSIIIALATFFLLIGLAFISSGLARYCFKIDGLEVKYPLQPRCLIPWEDFQQVCIVYAAFTTRGERRANTVICCVKKGEKKNIYGRWKTDNPFRYRTVICIAYSPELYEGIKEKCPYKVEDLRNTPAYWLK